MWSQSLLIDTFQSYSICNYVNRNLSEELYVEIGRSPEILYSRIENTIIAQKICIMSLLLIDNTFKDRSFSISSSIAHMKKRIPNFTINTLYFGADGLDNYEVFASFLMDLYVRVHYNPSLVSVVYENIMLKGYEDSLCEWSKRIIDNSIIPHGLTFFESVGSAFILVGYALKHQQSLIRFQRLYMKKDISHIQKIANWKEMEVILKILRIKGPKMDDLEDKLCLMCFMVDFFQAVQPLGLDEPLQQDTSMQKFKYRFIHIDNAEILHETQEQSISPSIIMNNVSTQKDEIQNEKSFSFHTPTTVFSRNKKTRKKRKQKPSICNNSEFISSVVVQPRNYQIPMPDDKYVSSILNSIGFRKQTLSEIKDEHIYLPPKPISKYQIKPKRAKIVSSSDESEDYNDPILKLTNSRTDISVSQGEESSNIDITPAHVINEVSNSDSDIGFHVL